MARGKRQSPSEFARTTGASQSLAFETVLSVPEKLEFIDRERSVGYFVRAFFVGTSDPTINASRVARRVMAGGHTVPIEKILARYARSMANAAALTRTCDRAYVYDNSVDETEARLLLRYRDGLLRKAYGEVVPQWIRDLRQASILSADFEDTERS